jgi:Holliday junction DNA helicase RuvA
VYAGKGGEDTTLLDVSGVGYAVRVPKTLLASLKPGAPLALFIHTAVREDAIDLYGFISEEELTFFRQLMSVSSIGPKTALGILNVADVKTLKRSIAQNDAAILTRVFGIGKKSAERIVLELHDKLMDELSEGSEGSPSTEDIDLIEALIALGYSAPESRKALKGVGTKVEGTKARLSAALRYMGSTKT